MFKTPEVVRVYIGSFGDQPGGGGGAGRNPQCAGLFEQEQAALLDDLHEIPQRCCDRKGGPRRGGGARGRSAAPPG